MRTLTIVVLTAVATLALVWAAFAVVAETGAVDVAATADYVPGAEWFFSTLSRESIRRHAAEAREAGDLPVAAEVSEATLRTGAVHYRSMCVPCHGAPGVPRGEIGEGMKPQPPDLAHSAREMSDAEVSWVIENGIRHTGMPAFGPSHSDHELAALTAFVERLGDLSPDDYRRLADGTAANGHAHGTESSQPAGDAPGAATEHGHDHGSPGDETEDENHHEDGDHHGPAPASGR